MRCPWRKALSAWWKATPRRRVQPGEGDWLEIGELAGVEVEALTFSLDVVMRESLMEGAQWVHIRRQPAQGGVWRVRRRWRCRDRVSGCPLCGSHQLQVSGGGCVAGGGVGGGVSCRSGVGWLRCAQRAGLILGGRASPRTRPLSLSRQRNRGKKDPGRRALPPAASGGALLASQGRPEWRVGCAAAQNNRADIPCPAAMLRRAHGG